jgi:ubiquinone/menaquinone biosynthesis C-methylase UbiE
MSQDEAAHTARILDQFTRQAEGFANLAAHSRADTLLLMLDMSGTSPSDRVLDVACGPGLLACALAGRAAHVTGVDMVPAMLSRAERERAARGLTNLSFELGDARALSFPDHSFDRVITRYSFHHLTEPAVVLAEMKRVCRAGGSVTVIDATPAIDKRAAYDAMELLRDPSHVRALTEQELHELFLSAGLTQIRKQCFELPVALEAQLAASCPEPGDADRIRTLFRDDVTTKANELGVSAKEHAGQIYFSYPCTIVTGCMASPSLT